MRWRSWQGLLAFAALVGLTGLTAWAGRAAWIFDHGWVPTTACAAGLVLLFAARREVPAYALALCLLNPVIAIGPSAAWWVPSAFVLLLAPLAWAGVTGLGRGQWRRAAGAWLVLFGQFFCLIYNVTHGSSGLGAYAGWVY